MYITNNSGPKIEPCGIPLKTVAHDENESFICTLCLLLVKKTFNPLDYISMDIVTTQFAY